MIEGDTNSFRKSKHLMKFYEMELNTFIMFEIFLEYIIYLQSDSFSQLVMQRRNYVTNKNIFLQKTSLKAISRRSNL